MLRTRLLWFTIGFSVSGAAISHFVWKDLMIHRSSVSSDMKQQFDALEMRISQLEAVLHHNSEVVKDESQ